MPQYGTVVGQKVNGFGEKKAETVKRMGCKGGTGEYSDNEARTMTDVRQRNAGRLGLQNMA